MTLTYSPEVEMYDDIVYTEYITCPTEEQIHIHMTGPKSFVKEIVWKSRFQGPVRTEVDPPGCYLKISREDPTKITE